MGEINDVTEIHVELVEHREQSSVRWVQFRVRRKAKERDKTPEPADVTLVMRAARVGVREGDLDVLVHKYGALKVTEGLDAMEAYINDPAAGRINNRGAYLKAVLANRFPDGAAPQPLSAQELKAVPKPDPVQERQQLADAWTASKLRELRAEFAALPEQEQGHWMDRAREHRHFAVMTPAMRRRLDDRQWESPLICQIVLDTFATARHGAGWREPSEMDLIMYSVAEARRAAESA